VLKTSIFILVSRITMSTETDAQALTGKAKKAKRSEERYKKNKKKSSSSSSSSKKEGDTTESTTTTADGDHAQEKDKDMTADANVKQDKKRKRSEEEKTTTPCSEETPAEGGQQKKQKKPKTDKAAAKQGSQEDSAAAAAAKPQRFICRHNRAFRLDPTRQHPAQHGKRHGQIKRLCVFGVCRLRSHEDVLEKVPSQHV
jgi:hypothetical protein